MLTQLSERHREIRLDQIRMTGFAGFSHFLHI